MNLYSIAQEYSELLSNLYDPETGEVDETSLIRLNEMKETLENKCIAVASYIENMEAERKAIEEAKKKMAERESRYKKQVANMKSYLLENMKKSQVKKISCPYFDIALHKNPPSVEVYDENAIPPSYNRIKVEKNISAILDDLKNGVIIPGARLIQKDSVRIK